MRKWICVGVIGGLLEFGFVYQVAFSDPDVTARESSSPEGKQIISARGAAPADKAGKRPAGDEASPAAPQAAAPPVEAGVAPPPAAPSAGSPEAIKPEPELTPEGEQARDREIRAQRALARLAAKKKEAAEIARLAEESRAAAERKAEAARQAEAERLAAAERKAAQEDLSEAASTVAARAVVAPLAPPAAEPIQLAQVLPFPDTPAEPAPAPGVVDLASLTIEQLIRHVFGSEGDKALQVAWCESTMRPQAQRGQFLGLFQMGENERADYGHGPDPVAQVLAAHALFLDRGWQPWACA